MSLNDTEIALVTSGLAVTRIAQNEYKISNDTDFFAGSQVFRAMDFRKQQMCIEMIEAPRRVLLHNLQCRGLSRDGSRSELIVRIVQNIKVKNDIINDDNVPYIKVQEDFFSSLSVSVCLKRGVENVERCQVSDVKSVSKIKPLPKQKSTRAF